MEIYLNRLKTYARHIEICGETRNSYSKTDHDATFMRVKRDYMGNDQLLPAYNMLFYILMNALSCYRNKIEKRIKFTYKAFYFTYDCKVYRTIRSVFYSVDHICYASKCNYFVTCDCALSAQAREIYCFLGCKTCVIYCEKKIVAPSLSLKVLCEKIADSLNLCDVLYLCLLLLSKFKKFVLREK